MDNPQEKPGVHVLYKKLGETPRECLERFKRENSELGHVPLTYAGRLDPIAEGVLVALSGEAIAHKDTYLGLPKVYEAQVLWGFETDTLDILGLVSSNLNSPRATLGEEAVGEISVPSVEKVQEMLAQSVGTVGKFQQKYPAYSSQPVSGKSLFQWAREGKIHEIEIPIHEVEILEPIIFLGRKEIIGEELLAEIEKRIALVSGDFRQKEIVEKWRDVLDSRPDDVFTLDSISCHVGSGFYVRQFVSDLAHSLGTLATTFHIVRKSVGEFSVEK